MIRVVDVRHLRTPAERATVVYVGRPFAGWKGHRLGNPFKPRPGFDAIKAYAGWLQGTTRVMYREYPDLESELDALWAETRQGELPLGCWCVTSTAGDGSPVVCHAQVLAELLRERFCS